MGKASSSKKVQRAARAAAASRGASERRELGFPLIVTLVVLLGIGLVAVARSSRDPLTAPRTSDHWHAAYTLYDCGNELPSFQGTADPDGIHSHQDSLIHIHPFNSSATGADATLSVFLEAMEATLTVEEMSGREFGTIPANGGCGDEPSVIKVARWDPDAEGGPELLATYEEDFGDIQFLEDREAFTVARVPVGEDPPPPSQASLDQLDVSTGADLLSEGPVSFDDAVTSTLPGDDGEPADDTEDPDAGTEEPADDTEDPDAGTEEPADDAEEPDAGTEDPAGE